MSKRQSKMQAELIAEFEAEARRLAGGASENERRWIAVALSRGQTMEPVGVLAGESRLRAQRKPDRSPPSLAEEWSSSLGVPTQNAKDSPSA